MVTKVLNRIKSRYDSWEEINVVMIVSTGRTATKFFAGFFDRNFRDVLARHEPAPDLFNLGTQFIRLKASPERTRTLLKRYRHTIYGQLKDQGISTYVESNNNAALLLPVVRAVFPKLKVVWVTRDPRSYLVSAYSKVHGDPGYSLYGKGDPRNRLTAKDFNDDPLAVRWDGCTRFEKLCWHWKTYNKLIYTFLDDAVDHCILKYEDLFRTDDFSAVRKLVDYVALDSDRQLTDEFLAGLLTRKSNESTSYALPSFDAWDEKHKASFYAILGEDIARYGYA